MAKRPKIFSVIIELVLVVLAITVIVGAVAVGSMVDSQEWTIETPNGTFSDTGCTATPGLIKCSQRTYVGENMILKRKGVK